MDHSSIRLAEDDIPGAKLLVNINELNGSGAIRWLKCRNARKLSKLTLNESKEK